MNKKTKKQAQVSKFSCEILVHSFLFGQILVLQMDVDSRGQVKTFL